jgi:arsenical pump membrane protein
MNPRKTAAAANPLLLLGVFGIAVGLGALARSIGWLATLSGHTGRWASAGTAGLAAVLVNNLPAAVMLSTHAPAHPRALLVGLDVGPNLAVTGSLSAILWLQVARAAEAEPSVRRYSQLGLVFAPAGVAAALGLVSLLPTVGF